MTPSDDSIELDSDIALLVPLTETVILYSDYDEHDANPQENSKLQRTLFVLL
jgi:hypothetical protein